MERVERLLRREEPVTWVFIGDSITHGALHTFGSRDFVELFSERVRFELGRMTDVVINTGISGDTTRGLLTGFDWRVGRFAPDAVFVMIGMNDCSTDGEIGVEEFEGNVDAFVEKVGDSGAVAVVQTTCPVLPGQAPEREGSFGDFMEAVRRVAGRRGLPLVDHERHWREHADSHSYWMSNAFHPNAYGHRAFAALIYRELGICDAESQCCRLHVP